VQYCIQDTAVNGPVRSVTKQICRKRLGIANTPDPFGHDPEPTLKFTEGPDCGLIDIAFKCMIFEVLTAVVTKSFIFWDRVVR
jgi:hypothetical protein